ERALDHTTITDTPERLAALRAELAAGYGRAQAAIFQGLAALDDDEHLHELAGDLYWRAFRRLLSPAIAANDRALASTSLELLGALSERALPAIVHEGKKRLGAEPATASAVDDPWLSTVVAFCATEERLEPSAAVTSRLVARVAFLKKVPLFTRMPSADLLPIAAACDEVDVAPGAVIFDEGAVGSSLYVVLEGTVDIVKGDARLNTLAPGDVFGEVAVLAESTRTAKAVARGAVRCVVLEGQRFREIVRKNGDIGLAVIQVLTERLRVATEREAQLRASLTPPT
ncbi:cyclic nucleotide-binding domain-containing protein, partial [Myxococcota bacterium]|nr:cyclic nucleotide-binding domain-containing protein [Myxococcota bacterium]